MRLKYWISKAFLIMAGAMMLNSTAAGATTMTLQTANELFAAGNAFYRSQQYEEAREAYRELLESGYDTAPVLYNLGTVNARLGNSTTAAAYLMRARNLRPRNPDIRANLNYVMPKPQADNQAVDASSVESLWSRIAGFFTIEEWLAVIWGGLMLVCSAAAVSLLVRSARVHLLARLVVWVGGILLFISAAPAATQYHNTRVATKSIVLSSTEMLSGPASRFTRISNLSEGQIVRDLGAELDGYRHVRLENGLQGYVNVDALMQL